MSKEKIILSTLVFVLTAFVQLSFAQTFPQSVITQMAARKMRYHHYLWHNVRDRWNSFPDATKAAFTSIGWAPTRPSRTADGSIILDNGSGEDFLCMHRNMIATANSIIATNKDPYGKIKGWTKLPAPGDKSFPVPAPYVVTGDASSTNSSNTRKTDAFYRDFIAPNEKLFTDPVQLKKMSLGEFGARIEVTVHNFLHMRFSDKCPYGYRPGSGGLIPNVSKTWDDARYNWLGDTYSSHVNPLFWSIHGWVDDRIEDWRKAHGLTTIPWSKTWNGGPTDSLPGMSSSSMASMAMSSDGMSTSSVKLASGRIGILTFGPMLMLDMASNDVGDVMQQALNILSKSGVQETSFADDVAVAPWDNNAEPVDPVDPVGPTPPVTPPIIPVIPVIPVKPVKPVIPVIPSLRPPRV